MTIDKKCGDIVGFFRKSTTAREKFVETQISINPMKRPL